MGTDKRMARRRVSDFPIAEPTETMLRTLTDALNLIDIGIILLDRHMCVRFINHRLIKLFGPSASLLTNGPHYRELLAFAGANQWFAVPSDQLTDFLARHEDAVRAGSISPTRIDLADGRRLLFSCKSCPDGGRILTYADISRELQREVLDVTEQMGAELRFSTETLESQGAYLVSLAEAADESGRKVEMARQELVREIAERRHLETELRRLATTDGLTGALNRSAFMAAGQREMELAQQLGHPLVVLMFDVDHFKTVNDRYGHAGGDLALQHLVATLRSGIRDDDVLGRLGGEEFAVVLIADSPNVAEEIAERLRSRVEATRLAFGESVIEMTISVGLAFGQATDRTIEHVIARADTALYQAKEGGRNRVVKDPQAVAA
jgi:diguanylate cyclase (GGDEF)-like protein